MPLTGMASSRLPRVLIGDMTAIGGGTATGELKGALFRSWAAADYLQIYDDAGSSMLVCDGSGHGVQMDGTLLDTMIRRFSPEIIIYRPLPERPKLHATMMELIRTFPRIPLVLWIMDDWPSGIEHGDTGPLQQMVEDWKWLLRRSSARFAISRSMAQAMNKRYGHVFDVFANGVDVNEWSATPTRQRQDSFVIRYAGGLAQNMSSESVYMVAKVVEQLADEGLPVRFEIRTREHWRNRQLSRFGSLKHTSFVTTTLSLAEYRDWLSSADSVVIAYNFDSDSLRYVGLSIANKLPECLACGAPVIGIGPDVIPTISELKRLGCAVVIDTECEEALRSAISGLISNPDMAKALVDDARRAAFTHFNLVDIRTRFETKLRRTARYKGTIVNNKTFDVTKFGSLIRSRPNLRRASHARFGEWLMPRAPQMFRVLQFGRRALVDLRHGHFATVASAVKARSEGAYGVSKIGVWILRAAFRHPVATLNLAGLIGAIALLPFVLPQSWPHRGALWSVAAIGLLGALAIAVLAAISTSFARLSASQQRLVDEAAERLERVRASLLADGLSKIPLLANRLNNIEARSTDQQFQVDTLRHETETRLNAVDSRIAGQQLEMDAFRLETDSRLEGIIQASAGQQFEMEAFQLETNNRLRQVARASAGPAKVMEAGLNGLAEIVAAQAARLDQLSDAAGASGLDKLRQEVSALQAEGDRLSTQFNDLATRLELLETLAASPPSGPPGLRTEIGRQAALAARLREGVAAVQRQLGELRYPNAPTCIVFFGHHKCASRLFRGEIFTAVAEMIGARIRKYEIREPPFHYSKMDELDLANIDFSGLGDGRRDVLLFSNASSRSLARVQQATADWRGLRILRDPRQVLVSDYFHHKGDHHTEFSGWVWDQLVTDQPILRSLPQEEGLLYELDNISKGIIEEQLLAKFDDERVLTLKIEDFDLDPQANLVRISQFIQVPDIAGVNLSRTGANPDSGPWSDHFTPRLREAFKERYGQALIDLGYAKDFDW